MTIEQLLRIPDKTNGTPAADQSLVIALADARSGELDGSRQRSFDDEGMRPSAGEHRVRTTIPRQELGAGNGKGSLLPVSCTSLPPRLAPTTGLLDQSADG